MVEVIWEFLTTAGDVVLEVFYFLKLFIELLYTLATFLPDPYGQITYTFMIMFMGYFIFEFLAKSYAGIKGG